MPFYVKTSSTGSWKTITKFFVKTSTTGDWKAVQKAFIKNVSGGWSQFWPKAGPTLSTPLAITADKLQYPSSGTAYPKLTGYNYNWSYNGSLTLNYSFQKSKSLNGSYSNLTGTGGTGTISNPTIASGGNSPSDYTLQYPRDFVANPTYFTFNITATDSNGVTTETSNNNNNGNGYVAIYGPTVTISTGTWSSGPYFSNSSATYTIGTVANSSYTRTYITRSDGTVVLNDTTFSSKVKYVGATPTDNKGSTYTLYFDSTDVGKTYSAYTIAYDLSDNGTSSGTATMSSSVIQALTISTQPTTILDGQYLGAGYQLLGNTGTFSTTPDGVYWVWQYSPDNVPANFKTMYNSSGIPLSSGVDTLQAQNHYFTIPSASYIYNVSNSLVYTPTLNGYIRLYSNAYIGSTYADPPTNTGVGPIVNTLPSPTVSASILSPTTVSKTTYGTFGTWDYVNANDTTYSYVWQYYNGTGYSQIVNPSGTAFITNKQLYGTTGVLTTRTPGGYRAGGSLSVAGVDSLFNGTWNITGIYRDQIYIDLSTIASYSYTTVYTANSGYLTYQGAIYQPAINLSAPTAFSYSTSYSVGANVTSTYRYYCTTAYNGNGWSSTTSYSSGNTVIYANHLYSSNTNNNLNHSPTGANGYIYWSDLGDVTPSAGVYWKLVSPTDTFFFSLINVSSTSSSGAVAGTSYSEGINLPYPFYSSVPLFIPPTVTNPGILRFIVTATNISGSGTSVATHSLYGEASATFGTVTNGNTTASIPYTLTNGGELDISVSPTGATYNSVYYASSYASSGTISISGLTPGSTYTLTGIPYNTDLYAGTQITTTLSPYKLYTVTWNANGGSVSPSSSQQTTQGGSVNAPLPTLSGYTFNGWYDSASGGRQIVTSGSTYVPTSDITLYAQWTLTPVAPYGGSASISGVATMGNNLSISINDAYGVPSPTSSWVWQRNDGGTGGNTYATRQTNGSTYLLGNYDAGYSIRAVVTWTNSSGSQVVTTNSIGPIAATYWTISYNANGGTYSGSSTSILRGGTGNVTSTVPTRSGYSFSSWNTAANGSGTSYASSDLITPTSDMTLYAQWAVTFVTPTCIAPSLAFQPRAYQANTLKWYCDYPTPSGSVSYIIGMDFEIRTTAGGGTLLASGTRSYPGAGTYPYSANGSIWAFAMGTAQGDITYSASARYGRARVQMMGTNGTIYYGTWSGWV